MADYDDTSVGQLIETAAHINGWQKVRRLTARASTLLHGLSEGASILFQLPAKSHTRSAGNYTTTSTSLADVDATNFSHTITTEGGDVEVTVSGCVQQSAAGNQVYLNILADAALQLGTDGLVIHAPNTGYSVNFSFALRVTGLSSGSHTFKLQWKVNAGTGTLLGSSTAKSQFSVKEVPPVS